MSYKKLDVDKLVSELDLSTKIKLLAGKDFWHFEGSEEHGIPNVRTSDGPNGVRGLRFFAGCPSSCFPAATGLAASFDKELAQLVGDAMGNEARAKGVHIVLGPTVNIQRHPRGGRGFESYSEDPLLSGLMAASFINGLQAKHVAACIKHFVGNDQEFERFSSDSVISERALREIYLEPFRLALKYSQPRTFMSAYNRVNGTHASENTRILKDILRDEWNFKGLIMSDWTGTYSTIEAIQATLDVEMPGPPVVRGSAVSRAVAGGELEVAHIDNCVRNVLDIVNYSIDSKIPFDAPEKSIDTPESRILLRQAAASSVVLLKNDSNVLPLEPKPGKSIAVIGSNAQAALISGGGSASLLPTFAVSPLDALLEDGQNHDMKIHYSAGPSIYTYTPLLDGRMWIDVDSEEDNGQKKHKHGGVLVEFSEQNLGEAWLKGDANASFKTSWSTASPTSFNFMVDGMPKEILTQANGIRVCTNFVPESSGDFKFGIVSEGYAQLFIDGKKVVGNLDSWEKGDLFFGRGSTETTGIVKSLTAGQSYKIEARMIPRGGDGIPNPLEGGSALRIGAGPNKDIITAIREAVDLAKKCDDVVVVVGLDKDIESEGFDRKEIGLPSASNDLISAILEEKNDAVIIIQSGTPCTMPWIHRAPTVVQAFYGGNETGHGISDVLFGRVDARGRCPITFPVREEDVPSYLSFSNHTETPGKTVYNEGIFVGYKYYEKKNIKPLFAFGHGLSYTTFEWQSLDIIAPDFATTKTGEQVNILVEVALHNIGHRDGEETIQVYVAPPQTSRLVTPIKKLGGFGKIKLRKDESATIAIHLERNALASYHDVEEAWVIVNGDYDILVGPSSDKIQLIGKISIPEEITWKGL